MDPLLLLPSVTPQTPQSVDGRERIRAGVGRPSRLEEAGVRDPESCPVLGKRPTLKVSPFLVATDSGCRVSCVGTRQGLKERGRRMVTPGTKHPEESRGLCEGLSRTGVRGVRYLYTTYLLTYFSNRPASHEWGW